MSFNSIIGQEYTLSFKVVNEKTGIPLENVAISIQPCSCGGISDKEGLFSIDLPKGKHTINSTFIGFKDHIQTIELNKDTLLYVNLYEQGEELSEVIIKAKNINDNLELPQMGVIRLKPLELKKIPSAVGEFDVLRGMTLLAGVNNSGEISNGLTVRGGSLDQNLLLYDYAPIFNPTHLFGLFSVFTPDVLSSVDLYRANIPSRFGGRTTSVLDIKVKKPYVDKFKLTGGVGLVSSKLGIQTPIIKDKLMLITGIRAGFTDFLLPVFSKRLKNTKAKFYDGTLKLLYLPTEKDQITFTGFYSKDFYQLDLITKIDNIVAENNQYDFHTLNGTVNWLHTFNNQLNLKTILVKSNYKAKTIFPEIESANEIEFETKIDYSSFISEVSKKVNNTFDYYVGLQANQYKISPGELDPGNANNILPVLLPKETSYELSGFTNFNWKPSPSLSLSAGLRYTHFLFQGPYTLNTYDETGTIVVDTQFIKTGENVSSYSGFEPRLGVNLKLGETASLKASYAKANQYLQNIYNSTTPIPTSRWKTSDPHIKPQNSDIYGLGIYKNFMDNKIEVGVEGYYRNTENNLTYKPGADFFLEESLENDVIQAQGKAYGVEFSFKKPKGKINGWFNYTWSRSLLRTSSKQLFERVNNNSWYASDFDRPHVINGTINFEGNRYNTWSLNFTAQTGRPYTVANGVVPFEDLKIPVFLERNNARLPTYHRLDFSWKVKYSKKKNKRWVGDWTFTIYNVYARKNPFSNYYTQRNGTKNGYIFGDSPLGSYELSVVNSPIFAMTYNFVFQ